MAPEFVGWLAAGLVVVEPPDEVEVAAAHPTKGKALRILDSTEAVWLAEQTGLVPEVQAEAGPVVGEEKTVWPQSQTHVLIAGVCIRVIRSVSLTAVVLKAVWS